MLDASNIIFSIKLMVTDYTNFISVWLNHLGNICEIRYLHFHSQFKSRLIRLHTNACTLNAVWNSCKTFYGNILSVKSATRAYFNLDSIQLE